MSDAPDTEALEWKQPPHYSSQRGKWQAIADELRRHPGEWAKLPGVQNSSLVRSIKVARMKAWAPAGSFEATGRNCTKSGQCEIYVRFVGEA